MLDHTDLRSRLADPDLLREQAYVAGAWIGADDDSKMWFNDRLVWISSRVDDKPWYRQPFYRQRTALATRNLSEGQRKLHFHKGRNTILFKLYNGVNLMFYSVVLSQ